MTITIKCKCGTEIIAPDSSKTTCPTCGAIYTTSTPHVEWADKDWISLPTAARRFDVPLPTLRYHAKRRHFAAYKPDKRTWLAEAGSVKEWVKERRR